MAVGVNVCRGENVETMKWSTVMVALVMSLFLVVGDAQPSAPAPLPDYKCNESMTQLTVPAKDPCANTTVYVELSSCANFMAGNVSAPSAACCESVQTVWSTFPACFCKVTFFSKFPGSGPALARARAPLCNVTADLCSVCPTYMSPHRSENNGGHSRKLNTASVVTISVIVTLALVGCGLLVYCCRKRALSKQNPSHSKNYVPQFNNM